MSSSVKYLNALATVLFIVAIPLAIITTNVRLFALDPSYYEDGQLNYGARQTIGLTVDEIRASSRTLSFYFGSDADLPTSLKLNGLSGDFFSPRDAIHLVDVRDIVRLVFRVEEVALAYVALFTAVGFAVARKRFWRTLARNVLAGAGITAGLIVVLGLLSIVDFSGLFLLFHEVSFSNDFWILDPNVDLLIRMFPPQFFFKSALNLGVYSLVEAFGLVAVFGGALLRQHHSKRK